MASMTPCHGPSLGRRIGICRRYPGGKEYSSIFLIVFHARPNSRATARRLLPSTSTARRTRAYKSTSYMPPVSHGNTSPAAPNPLLNLVRYPSSTLLSVKPECGGVDYFYSATSRRSRGATWSIFAPPRTVEPLKDTDDGLRGFELQDADGYVLFFGRARS